MSGYSSPENPRQVARLTSSDEAKTVVFVRHGQSVDNANASGVFQSVNSPLNEKGRAQSIAVANRLASIPFDSLISSPLRRAKETAQIISSRTGKQVLFSGLFVERIKPTAIDGKPWTDEEARKTWQAWRKTLHTPGERVADGENFDDIVSRADEALSYLETRPESSLTVVTHGYFLRTLIARTVLGDHLTGESLKHFQEHSSVSNTGITVMQYTDTREGDRAWQLQTFNDHSHLAK